MPIMTNSFGSAGVELWRKNLVQKTVAVLFNDESSFR